MVGIMYKRCTLIKNGFAQTGRCTTAWIPIEKAIKGKVIRLKDDDGWHVIEVSNSQKTREEIIAEQERIPRGIFDSIKRRGE